MSQSAARPGIVVLGPPRSGTTLLRRILDAHSAIACPPETYVLSGAARFLHEEQFAQGLRIGVTHGLAFAGFDEADVLTRLRSMAFSFLDDYRARQGKARWAHKTAFDAFHVPAIRRVCDGHVRYVTVQRHGLDVACSLADLVDRTGGYVDELHRYLQREPEPLVAFAQAWADCSGSIAGVSALEGSHHIRYEDLVADPVAVSRRLFEALEEDADDSAVARALSTTGTVGFGDWKTYARSAVDASSVDRWRALPRAVVARLADVCNPMLERLGYDRIDVEPETADPAAARRRYELGLLVNRMKSGPQ